MSMYSTEGFINKVQRPKRYASTSPEEYAGQKVYSAVPTLEDYPKPYHTYEGDYGYDYYYPSYQPESMWESMQEAMQGMVGGMRASQDRYAQSRQDTLGSNLDLLTSSDLVTQEQLYRDMMRAKGMK